MDILEKIKQANLVGRGGASFPVAKKWEAVKQAEGEKKYLVVNAAEGEPGVYKDGYLLENYSSLVAQGIKLVVDYLDIYQVYFYIHPEYYKKFKARIVKSLKNYNLAGRVKFFVKPHEVGYIGGEETAVLNAIEGKKIEPRVKPPYPTTCGLFGQPTLINNVETFYNVALVERGEFYDFRWYTVSGAVAHPGVFAYPAKWTVKMVLEESKNYPEQPFFVVVGGDASGEVLNQHQLEHLISGAGSITVYDLNKHRPATLLKYWLEFFKKNSCGQCTPCREGTYRLVELLKTNPVSEKVFMEIINDLEVSSFCALGSALPVPVKSYLKNIANNNFKNLFK